VDVPSTQAATMEAGTAVQVAPPASPVLVTPRRRAAETAGEAAAAIS
jgi:hypothetical protein